VVLADDPEPVHGGDDARQDLVSAREVRAQRPRGQAPFRLPHGDDVLGGYSSGNGTSSNGGGSSAVGTSRRPACAWSLSAAAPEAHAVIALSIAGAWLAAEVVVAFVVRATQGSSAAAAPSR
jgi:hypothetical protein